jgi:hypothetical protein
MEGFGELDLVMISIKIGVDDYPLLALGQCSSVMLQRAP